MPAFGKWRRRRFSAWIYGKVQVIRVDYKAPNPSDTKDYPDGAWSLPPSLLGGVRDRAKYGAVGESDRMTLKFVKVDKRSDRGLP